MLMYQFNRRVHVYETDLMGIVHHSNYVRYCEEARVEWFIQNNILDTSPRAVYSLTVIGLQLKYIKPLRYGDEFYVRLQLRCEGVRCFIQYKLFLKGRDGAVDTVCVIAETVHCSIDESFKVIRLDPITTEKILSYQKESPWIETWL